MTRSTVPASFALRCGKALLRWPHLPEALSVFPAPQRGGADCVAADIKDDRVPVHRESGLDFRRKRERLDAGVCEVRRDQADFLHLHLLAALGQAEVGVDHIQVQQFGALAALRGPERKVQRQF